METLSCHSNESTLATTIKNIFYVEANVMQSFSFIPLMASEKKIFEYFFQTFSLSVAMATNQNQRFGQVIWLVKEYSRNISAKLFSKHLQ